MTTPNRGVGKFTTQNLVAIVRAVPESTGTYADVTRVAADHGGDFQPHNIANWVQGGNADIRDGNTTTAYARFAKIYRELREEHCGAEINRSRELDRALETIARTCQCGNQKTLMANGHLSDQCQVCHTLDATPRSRTAPDGSKSSQLTKCRRLDTPVGPPEALQAPYRVFDPL